MHPLLLSLDVREPLPEPIRAELAASLAPLERQRWQALRLEADRERFLRGRGALRRLLGAWRCEPPVAVPIGVGAHGKPCCTGGPEFNLSHSGDLILLALHGQRPVGVDVEQVRPGLDWRPIARRVLPPAEWQALEARYGAGGGIGEEGLGAWCRLEARLKALGLGLAGLPQAEAALEVWDVAVPAGYRAALALAPAPPP